MVRPLFELVCSLCQAWALAPGVPPTWASLPAELSMMTQLAPASFEEWLTLEGDPEPAPRTPRSLGDRWSLRDGRALSIYLTPSPERCAPWMEMRF